MENLPNHTESNEPTGWENMDNTLNAVVDVENTAENQEIETTPEEYENFAKRNFTRLLGALENPEINIDNIKEQEITDQITITADILSSLDKPTFEAETSQPRTKDVFSLLENKYQNLITNSNGISQARIVDLNQRLIHATYIVRNQFINYTNSQKPKNPDDLPDDVIS